jgi:hypothetical protein
VAVKWRLNSLWPCRSRIIAARFRKRGSSR